MTGFSSTTATVDLSALGHNLAEVRRRVPPRCEILAIVKADAYGHGAVPVARALARLGVARFGVATLEEGVALRDAGITQPILVMGALFPDHIPDLIGYQLTPVLYDQTFLERFAHAMPSRPAPYPVHLKVDTGMARLGFDPEMVLPVLQSPPFKGALLAEGLMTHLADADGHDPAYTTSQIDRLQVLVKTIEAAGLSMPLAHAANTAAILQHPHAHLDLVRPGLMLYGYHTVSPSSPSPALQPVLRLTTKVIQVRTLRAGESVSYNRTFRTRRPSRVATLAIGYADGYRRALSNRGAVLLGGDRAPVVGQVCMDMTLVDVTDRPEVKPGDEAVLIGRQGAAEISAMDVAQWADTIPYEILCGIGPRVKRRYVSEPA